MRRMGKALLADKKADIKQAAASAGGKVDGRLQGLRSRDLLTLLIKANQAEDIPEHQRLSDEDVLARTCYAFFCSGLLCSCIRRGPDVGTALG